MGLVHFGDLLLEPFVRFGVEEVSFDVIGPLRQPIPLFQVDGIVRKLGQLFAEVLSESLRVDVVSRESDNRKLLREEILLCQIQKRRYQLALRQVARGPKNYHDAWSRRGGGFHVIRAHLEDFLIVGQC